MDPRLDTKSAINEAVIREIERAGLFGNEKLDRQAITSALLDGPQDDHQRQQLNDFAMMVDIGHPDTDIDESFAPFGLPAKELRKSMLAGQEGRGWSQEDVDKAGRLPRPRELSPGHRQFQEIDRRSKFLQGLIKSHGAPESEPSTYNYGSPSGPMRVSRSAVQDRAADEFNRTRDQKFGESGWVGHMENPEYLTGRVMNNVLDPTMRKLQYLTHDNDTFEDADTHTRELREAQAASKVVSPLLPGNPRGFEDREAAYKQVKGMADKMLPISYDFSERERTGSYPSFVGSKMREFTENMADPPTLLAALLTGGVSLGGSFPAALAKSAKAIQTLPRLASVYTKNAARAGKAASKVGATVGNVIGPEEGPLFAGIQGTVYASDKNLMDSVPGNVFSSGNLARTDLYEQGPDGKPREQSQDEFMKSYNKKLQEQTEARKQLDDWKKNAPGQADKPVYFR
jgi:hypothetical protein